MQTQTHTSLESQTKIQLWWQISVRWKIHLNLCMSVSVRIALDATEEINNRLNKYYELLDVKILSFYSSLQWKDHFISTIPFSQKNNFHLVFSVKLVLCSHTKSNKSCIQFVFQMLKILHWIGLEMDWNLFFCLRKCHTLFWSQFSLPTFFKEWSKMNEISTQDLLWEPTTSVVRKCFVFL